MRLDRQKLTIVGIVLLVTASVALLGFSIYYANQQTQQPAQETPTETTGTTDPEQAESDGIESLLVTNFEVLTTDFDDVQYFFISDTIETFAFNNFPDAGNIQIDKSSFGQRSPTSYGFNVLNEAGVGIFYVIVTKVENDQVKVDCYL